MASNEFIQSLINQLTEEGVKLAADDEKSDREDKRDSDKDKKEDKDNAFRERMRRSREKSDDKDEEQKAARSNFDLLAGLEALPEDLRKLASAEATSLFLADMARQNVFGVAAPEVKQASDGLAEADLFNHVFEMHTAKLASLDPTYAAILAAEQEKQAFNQGFEDAVAQMQQGLGVGSLNHFGGF